jgi:hypothetical protein
MNQRNHQTRPLIIILLLALVTAATAFARVPSRPTNIAARPVNGNGSGTLSHIIVHWEDGFPAPTGFKIWVSSDAGATWMIRNQKTGIVSSTHDEYVSVTTNGRHMIHVVLFNADGDSRPSDTVVVTTNSSQKMNRVEGRLVDTAGTGLTGNIFAYRVLDSLNTPGETVTVWARNGNFVLSNLNPGNYVFWGFGSDSVHLPGYHVANGVAAKSWTDATIVAIDADDTITGVEIKLVFMPGQGGSARLVGTINDAGRTRKADDPHILAGTPVEGAKIFALDMENAVAGYAMTDATGRFVINGLKEGTYTILADKLGFRPVYGRATASENGVTPVEIILGGSTSRVPTPAPVASQLAIYPNPVAGAATIRFDGSVGTASLKLVDLQGREVIARTITTVDGQNRVELETAGIAAGIYLLRIGSGAGAVSTLITVTR